MLTAIDDAVAHVVAAKPKQQFTKVKVALGDPENLCENGVCGYYCCDDSYGDEVDPDTEKLDGTETPQVLLDLDDAMTHVDMLTDIDDAIAHVDTQDHSSDLTAALDDAMAHIDMMTAIDDAFAHVDMMSAIEEAMDFVNKHQDSDDHDSDYSTPIIASAGALIAIGAGFVIKNKFSAVQQKDIEETLL